jgi:Xaa-Pro aminopeptidase
MTDRELWGQMALGMLRSGGDTPRFVHLGLASLEDVRGFPVLPVGQTVAPGQILYTEIDGQLVGYSAQGVQPAIVGPAPREWLDAWAVCQDAWDRTWEILRPGTMLRELSAAVTGASSGPYRARQALHGQGLGDDMPLLSSSATAANRMEDRALEVGSCFVLKPYAQWTDAKGPKELNWGDTVAITNDGPRRLGSRPHELIIRD